MKARSPRVSVIVPNFNHAPYLEARIESILNQSYQDVEVILLDDCSSDNSREVLMKYESHSKVSHLLINPVNSGSPFVQWKKGIDLAQGEFIWVAESDDCCHKEFLQTIMSSMNDSVVLSYSESKIIDDNDEEIRVTDWKQKLSTSKWQKSYINDGHQEISEVLKFRNTIPNASAVVFRKEALNDIEIPTDKAFCGDWLLWLRILEKGNLAYCHEKLNYFRKHAMTTRVSKSESKELKRHREYFDIIKKYNGFFSRIKNAWKFDWILNNWISNKDSMTNNLFFNPPFPGEFKVRFYTKYLKRRVWSLVHGQGRL